MVLKQRHSSGGPSSMMLQSPAPPPSSGGGGVSRQQHLAHLSREGSAVSLPYGSALSPTSSSASSALPGVGGTNNVVRRSQSASTPGAGSASASASALAQQQQQQQQQHRPLHLSPVPPSAGGAYGRSQSVSAVSVGGALSPTFFGTHTPTPTSKSSKRRSFWSSFADFTTGGGRYGGSGSSIRGRRLSSSPSKGPRRNHSNSPKAPLRSTLLAVLYVAAILSCGYLTVVTSRQLAATKSRHAQMKNDYHVLHHKVRETQAALQAANQINHDLEDRSKALARQNDGLQKELDGMMVQDSSSGGGAALESISPALLGKGGGDETLAGLRGEEITQLLIRRQDAMRGRIGTLQTKIQEISRREAEER